MLPLRFYNLPKRKDLYLLYTKKRMDKYVYDTHVSTYILTIHIEIFVERNYESIDGFYHKLSEANDKN